MAASDVLTGDTQLDPTNLDFDWETGTATRGWPPEEQRVCRTRLQNFDRCVLRKCEENRSRGKQLATRVRIARGQRANGHLSLKAWRAVCDGGFSKGKSEAAAIGQVLDRSGQ
jgi:hypothetical protein